MTRAVLKVMLLLSILIQIVTEERKGRGMGKLDMKRLMRGLEGIFTLSNAEIYDGRDAIERLEGERARLQRLNNEMDSILERSRLRSGIRLTGD